MRLAFATLTLLLWSGCTLLTKGRCGDGVIDENLGENCDDGNDTTGDGCDEVCAVIDGFACPTPGQPCVPVAECGNGEIETGEECEDGNDSNTDACVECQDAECGDGFVQAGVETCDPPDGAECNAQCQRQCNDPTDCADDNLCTENEDCVNNACVNTAVVPDDGDQCTADVCDPDLGVLNTVQNDGFACEISAGRDICLAGDCVASACGDGFEDEGNGEQCDDGNGINTDACPNDCSPALCGDGSIEGTETCDDGDVTPGDGCDQNCQIEVACGNNTIDAGEQCDDGNTTNGDGCDSQCDVENPVDCSVANAFQNALNSQSGNINIINGSQCSLSNTVSMTDRVVTIKSFDSPAIINREIIIAGNSTVIFENVFFNHPSLGNNHRSLDINGSNVKVAIINSILTNIDTDGPSRAIRCSAGNLLLDRTTVTGNNGDIVIELINSCTGIIANSILRDNPEKDLISLDSGSKINLFFSTFFRNDANDTENGVIDLNNNSSIECRMDSSVGEDVSNIPILNTGASILTPTNSFIFGADEVDVDNFLDDDINPQLNTTTFQVTNNAIIGTAPQNPTPSFFFNPATIVPGINLINHDFNNNPRPQGQRDPGAIELP